MEKFAHIDFDQSTIEFSFTVGIPLHNSFNDFIVELNTLEVTVVGIQDQLKENINVQVSPMEAIILGVTNNILTLHFPFEQVKRSISEWLIDKLIELGYQLTTNYDGT